MQSTYLQQCRIVGLVLVCSHVIPQSFQAFLKGRHSAASELVDFLYLWNDEQLSLFHERMIHNRTVNVDVCNTYLDHSGNSRIPRACNLHCKATVVHCICKALLSIQTVINKERGSEEIDQDEHEVHLPAARDMIVAKLSA